MNDYQIIQDIGRSKHAMVSSLLVLVAALHSEVGCLGALSRDHAEGLCSPCWRAGLQGPKEEIDPVLCAQVCGQVREGQDHARGSAPA